MISLENLKLIKQKVWSKISVNLIVFATQKVLLQKEPFQCHSGKNVNLH